MGNAYDFFARVERFCANHGISPATLCGRATGNARLFERMKRRAAQLQQDMERIDRCMASAPDGGDNAR